MMASTDSRWSTPSASRPSTASHTVVPSPSNTARRSFKFAGRSSTMRMFILAGKSSVASCGLDPTAIAKRRGRSRLGVRARSRKGVTCRRRHLRGVAAFGVCRDSQFVQLGRDVLGVAGGTNTVAKFTFGVAREVALDAVPIVLVIANAFAVGADREQSGELFDVGKRGG